MQKEKTKDCTECKEGKKIVLYCSNHKAPLCAKCGANEHRNCNKLWDCADLVRETKKLIDDMIRELNDPERKQEDKRSIDAFRSPDELKRMLSDVKTKVNSCKEMKIMCSKYIDEELKKKEEQIEKKGTMNEKRINNLIGKLEARLKDKKKHIEAYEEEKKVLDTKRNEEMFSEVYELYMKYISADSSVDADIGETLIGLDNQIKQFNQNMELNEIYEGLQFVLKRPKKESCSEHASETYLHYMNSMSNDLYLYDAVIGVGKRIELFLHDEKPFILPHRFDSIIAKGLLFILGGSDEKNAFLATVHEYSFYKKRVRPIAPLLEAKRDLSVEDNGDYLFCIGGRTNDGLTANCEKYCILRSNIKKEDDSWKRISSLCEPRMGAAVVSIRDSANPAIYVFGGLGLGGCTNTLEKLIINQPKSWIKVDIKPCEGWIPRYGAGSFFIEENKQKNIIVFGGTDEKDFNDAFMIDTANNALVPYPSANLEIGGNFYTRKIAYTRNNKRIYMLGLYDIYYYQVDAKKWEKIPEDKWHPI